MAAVISAVRVLPLPPKYITCNNNLIYTVSLEKLRAKNVGQRTTCLLSVCCLLDAHSRPIPIAHEDIMFQGAIRLNEACLVCHLLLRSRRFVRVGKTLKTEMKSAATVHYLNRKPLPHNLLTMCHPPLSASSCFPSSLHSRLSWSWMLGFHACRPQLWHHPVGYHPVGHHHRTA